MEYRIISIGTLSHHDLWENDVKRRSPHATCTLIKSGDKKILVDPGLPPKVMKARLHERSGLEPEQITDIFLTNFRPAHRWGIQAFPKATWHVFEAERQSTQILLEERYKDEMDPDIRIAIEEEMEQLSQCKNAPDQLAQKVDLFPLPGFTEGTCGLILADTTSTTVIAGDAIATYEHLVHGKILAKSLNIDKGKESFVEAIEIADAIIPGHDNILINPSRRPM